MSNYTVQWASGGTWSIPGKSSIILTDGETDSLNTSLTLTGRNVITYGQIQQGGGTGQGANKIYIGWASGLQLQVDTTNFANDWPISISGNAASASNAAYATAAGSANTATSASSASYATTAGNGGVTSVNGMTGAVTVNPVGLGVGQTWSGPARGIDTWYQNTTGGPIKVSISCYCNNDQIGSYFGMGASTGCYVTPTVTSKASDYYVIGDVIPNLWYYRMRAVGTNPSISA